ncbi:endonuclease VII domain-containing protein [Mesorhizobium sp. ESP-6-4]|uniref:endonuclease domain-containing protein n=1 Tax=Mesorhizobium sp. ESP-6-4 TaxID=2876624 RepID=UPI001CC95B31|nr:endonuclease domain-containing protein [Mesorhizobium sp. ESP-6-4]MBZ9659803.1 endonuclease VII domain-containing protein [Mesorhizobium sp. ESP-6-4]
MIADNDNPREKTCSMCEETKPIDAFHKQPTGKFGRHSYCTDCANTIRRLSRPTTSAERGYTQEQSKRWHLKRRYGLTPSNYESMLTEQSGNCAICGEQAARACVDHNHNTGKVRAILCHRCNIGLPYVEDAVFRERATAYLAKHEQEVA